MKLRERIIGSALTVEALFVTPGAMHEPPESVLLVQEMWDRKAEITEDFDVLRNYWGTKDSRINDIQISVILGDEKTSCGKIARNSMYEARGFRALLSYCQPDDTLLVNQTGLELMDTLTSGHDISRRDTMRFILAHEFGHAVQDVQSDAYVTSETPLEIAKANELTADCLGGVAMQAVMSDTAAYAATFYDSIGSPLDTKHGLPEERIVNFQHGQDAGACGIFPL